jgi:hypothetical protein
MDFIEGLTQSGNANCIFVVVAKFTKFGHFIALKHPYTTASVAKVFVDQVCKLHGQLLCLTEIQSSQATFGMNFSIWPRLH